MSGGNKPEREISSLDLSLKAITPEGVEFIISPAGFPVRTIAYAIDKMIQTLILLGVYIAMIFSGEALGVWIFYLLNFIVDWFYHVIFELAFRGQSPGKRLMGIRVIKSDGSPVDPASSFLRNLMRFADTFLSLFHIAFISMAASGGFRRIGDWTGGTIVVYSEIAKNSKYASIKKYTEKYDALNPQPAAFQTALSYEEKQAILEFARRYPLLGEARAGEIAGIYAPQLKNAFEKLPDSAFLLGIAKKLSGETL